MLSGKKTQKLGAKKLAGEEIDFDAAEKAAKAEAERIEKLGYDPEAEKAAELSKAKSTLPSPSISATKDTPMPAVNTSKTASGPANPSHARSPSEVERLGMGVARLGFGQVGANKPASSSAPAPRKLGFGSVGVAKAAQDGKFYNQTLLALFLLLFLYSTNADVHVL